MRKIKYIYIFLFLGFIFYASTLKSLAQNENYAFKVLAENGSVQLRSGSEWKPLASGAVLTAEDVIRVDEDGYLGLIHISGKTIALENAGTYEVAFLNSRFESKESGVATRYADLYIQNIQNGLQSKQNPAAAPNISAERALKSNRLKVLLPNSVDVFNPEVILRWNDKDTIARQYEVVFKNMFDEVVMVKETTDTKLMLDFSEQAIANERLVIVSVNAKQRKEIQSSSYGIKHMTAEEAEPIQRELRELKLEISDKENALDKLILASFYEQNNLLADALTSYEYAISMEPGVKAFQTAYEQFIFRNGLGY